MISFEKWLSKFVNDDSPLGDLARDYESTGCDEPLTLHYLQEQGACREAIVTFRKAMKNYKNQMSHTEEKKESSPCFFDNVDYLEWCEEQKIDLRDEHIYYDAEEFIECLHQEIGVLHDLTMFAEKYLYDDSKKAELSKLVTESYLQYERLQLMLELYHEMN